MATSLPVNSFTTTSSPPILHQNMKTISTDQTSTNNSNSSSIETPGVGMSCFTMTFGIISNLTALGILAKSRYRFRRQSKAPFLLLTVALLLADLGGHLILGSFALYLHTHNPKSTTEFCKIFGTSIVFFGLTPLLLACAMAVERCVAITKPFFHISMITVAHAKVVIIFLSSIALVLAVLPLFSVGTYTIQTPYKWCFLPLENPEPADKKLSLAFSGLGLTALTLSLLCNILSGVVLLQARLNSSSSTTNSRSCSTRRASSVSMTSSSFFSLDVEMMVQLATITVVSCVCWGPFLVSTAIFI